jgi:hypothetical protein
MAVPALLCGCKNWNVRKKYEGRKEIAEMKLFDLLRDMYYVIIDQTNTLENDKRT